MHGCQFQQWHLNWGQRHAMAAANHFLEARHVQVNSLAEVDAEVLFEAVVDVAS